MCSTPVFYDLCILCLHKKNYTSKRRQFQNVLYLYFRCGYNQWRDPMKPVQLLTKLCKEGKLDGPHFTDGKVRVGEKTFALQKDSVSKSTNLLGTDQQNSKSKWETLMDSPVWQEKLDELVRERPAVHCLKINRKSLIYSPSKIEFVQKLI